MKRILCIWEMGTALGHLSNLKLFMDEAQRRGFQVSLAVRELHNVPLLIDINDVSLYQSPYIRRAAAHYPDPMICYSQLILRQVFENESQLGVLYKAWSSIFEAVQPDIVVYDHAPSALVASLGAPWKKWVVGSGFLIPKFEEGMLGLFPGVPRKAEMLQTVTHSQEQLLSIVNRVLVDNGHKVITSPDSLYQQCDEQLFLTIPEVDHFGAREGARYLGVKWSDSGIAPKWRGDGGKKKAFAYLIYFQGVEKLLDVLLAEGVNLLIYSRNFPEKFIARYREKITFYDEPVNLSLVFAEAELFINNANHGSSAQAFASGVPQLMLPRHQEQLFLAKRVEQQKSGVIAFQDQPDFSVPVQQVLRLAKKNAPAAGEVSPQSQQGIEECFSRFLRD